MNKTGKERILEYITIIGGGAIVVLGIIFFIIFNKDYFGTNIVEGRVVSNVGITTSDNEKHQFITVQYYVGSKFYETQWEETGEDAYDEMEAIQIRYRAKNPAEVVEGSWEWMPIVAIMLGILLVVGGFMIRRSEFITTGQGMTKKARKSKAALLQAKARMIDAIFPLTAGITFTAFGVVMALVEYHIWVWIFIIIGGAFSIYMVAEIIMATVEYSRKKREVANKKVKIHVEDIEMK